MSLCAGWSKDVQKGTLSIEGIYCFNANYGNENHDFFGFDQSPSFSFKTHNFGIAVKYTFLNSDKYRFRPFAELMGYAPIIDKNKHRFFSESFFATPAPVETLGSYGSPTYEFYSNFYESTPFVGSALLGCDFRIVQHLHATVGIGYGIRVMKTKYIEWHEWEDEVGTTDLEKLLKTAPVTTHIFHLLDVQVGIYYGIGFGKKGKDPSAPLRVKN